MVCIVCIGSERYLYAEVREFHVWVKIRTRASIFDLSAIHHCTMSAKVKDGLFMGDSESAHDAEFLELNGIEYVINCTVHCVKNVFKHDNVRYVGTATKSHTVCSVAKTGNTGIYRTKWTAYRMTLCLIWMVGY